MNFDFEWTALLALIWRATWQAFVLAGIILCLTSTLHRWISPKWRALLWAIPLARLVLLMIPASGLSLFYLLNFESQNPTPAVAISFSGTGDIGLIPTLDSLQPNHRISRTETAQEYSVSQTSITRSEESRTNAPILVSRLLTYLWLTGSCIVLCRWIGSRIILARIIKNSEQLQDAGLLKLIEAIQKRNQHWFPVRCFVTNDPIGPSSCGFWRPTILLPLNLWSDFAEEDRQTIVIHELEHIHRQDVLLMLISRIAITVHWFNPLVYLISNRMRREIELAVDSATVTNFDEQARHDYGELLIRLAQQTQGPVAALPMAGKRSALRVRINQLTSPIQDSRSKSALAMGLLLILFVTGLSDVAQTQEKSSPTPATASPEKETVPDNKKQNQYFISGTVQDTQTGKPVTNAEIQILVASEPDPDKRVLKGTTNEAGRYRIEVPLGNVQLWFPTLKPGYWLMPEESMQALVTTPEKPIVNHDLQAQTGAVWNVHWKGKLNQQQRQQLGVQNKDQPVRLLASVQEVADDAKRAAWLKGEPVSFQKANATSMNYLDEEGRGQLTEVGTSGKYILTLVNMSAELIVAPGFDNSQVVALRRLPDSNTTQMMDKEGRKATIKNGTATINNGVPLLIFVPKASKPVGNQKLVGRVVDAEGKPLTEVRVGVVSGTQGGGSGDTGVSTKSALDGSFSLDFPIYDYGNQAADKLQFSVVLTQKGYAGMDSRSIAVSKNFVPIDFKTLTLNRGYSLPIRVLDEQGKPLPGAIVEPGNSYALRRQIVRTSTDGRAILKDLPSGVIRASVRWGTKIKWINLVISNNESENREVTIHLKEFSSATTTQAEKAKPLTVGQIAPTWEIAEWSDGRTRKLSDYRGQVVVLDFWGLSCSGCVTSIPAQKRLEKKFAKQGVVFLGIHTADGEMSQINKLKQSEQWTIPTGIDRGTSILDSVTGEKYGVQGYPALIVINTDGKITFRSDVEPSKNRETYMRELAEASGVKWPPGENASEAEMIQMMNQMQYTLLSREIERVLKMK
ncbi:M56 family metallopeptidase [Gimesia fumaroli]|uniref:Regulatory protein BlaR1 n=1 Tax=Gimesia fumaroli TaxID=2527976 RepID=A0A518IBK3_9PLAN|nr:M56 family metallopeptidase [Gimesia fumaroli]QDV50481.1 Regulatory protein BlaR1 [Gimesia fumaroli]